MNNHSMRTPSYMISNKGLKLIGVFVAMVFLSGCRGQISDRQPIHPNPNMDQQPRKEAQEVNNFFVDGRSMRYPVEGTIAIGHKKEDVEYYTGKTASGDFIAKIPVKLTRSFLYRGQNRFEVYCATCHGKVGDGKGIIMVGGFGYVPAPTYHQDRLRNAPDGEIYSAIANGVRTMPSYGQQIPVQDRWAIVAYIRALQISQNVPEAELSTYDVDVSALKSDYEAAQAKKDELKAANSGGGEEPSAELGEKAFTKNGCQACHSTDGSTIIGPTFLNLYGREETLADGSTITVDDEYIKESLKNPTAKLVEGFAPVMAPYDYLPDSEVLSIIEYIKTLSDN